MAWVPLLRSAVGCLLAGRCQNYARASGCQPLGSGFLSACIGLIFFCSFSWLGSLRLRSRFVRLLAVPPPPVAHWWRPHRLFRLSACSLRLMWGLGFLGACFLLLSAAAVCCMLALLGRLSPLGAAVGCLLGVGCCRFAWLWGPCMANCCLEALAVKLAELHFLSP